MTKIEIEVQNLDRLQAAFKRAPQVVRQRLDKALTTSAIIVQRMARQESPVDMGALRNSIGIRYLTLGAAISPSVKYAIWVHEGTGIHSRSGRGRSTPWAYKNRRGQFVFTRGIKANPFMERAAKLGEPQVRRQFDRAIEEIVDEVSA